MDNGDLLRQMRGEIPRPSRQELVPARDRLLQQIRAPRRAAWRRALLPGRALTRLATVASLSLALTGGLIASQTVDLSGDRPTPRGDRGGVPSGEDPGADVVLERAVAAVTDDRQASAQPSDFAYVKTKSMRQDPYGRSATLSLKWTSVGRSQPGLARSKKLTRARQPSFEQCTVETTERPDMKIVRRALREEVPETFREKMRAQLPESLEEMTFAEICKAEIDGQDLLQAAQEAKAQAEMHWRTRKIAAQEHEPSLEHPTYLYLRALPTDPDQLADKIRQRVTYLDKHSDPDFHPTPFGVVSRIFASGLVPPDTAAALFEVTKRFDGVHVRTDATLVATGRHGIAITGRNGLGEQVALIFDPESYELIGRQTTALEDTPVHLHGKTKILRAGTVTASSAILEKGIVDQTGQQP